MKTNRLLKRFLIWRLRHISNKQFIVLMSIVVGFCVGIAAIIIKNSVHLIRTLLQKGFAEEYQNYLYVAYPAIGILLAVLFIKYVIKKPVRHGIPNVLYSISKNNSRIMRHNMFSSIVTSALTVGFGGSVGLEGPTVSTGAAIGSNLGRLFHLNYKQVTLLLGCACAGAMAAIFKAPIAAIVFAFEVIMVDLTSFTLIPLLLASVTAVLTSYFFLGQDVLYPFEVSTKFNLSEVPFYVVLGIVCGLISVYFTRMYMFIHNIFDKIKSHWVRIVFGGLSLGILIFIFPALYGEGYEDINACLQGNHSYLFNHSMFYAFREKFWVVIALLAAIIFFKVVAASLTFGSGGVGGIFAPTLFMGVNTGYLFAMLSNHFGFRQLPENNFALIGMSGLISGVLHAPLTGIFLIADITGGYSLFLPLMIVGAISYVTVKSFESNSVYTIQLAKRKELITHHKDKAVLSLMRVHKLIERNFHTIRANQNLGDLVEVITKSTRNIFPVIDEENRFIGIVKMDDIRSIMFKTELYETTSIKDIMYVPEYKISVNDSMEEVAKKFQQSGRYNIVVLDEGKYLGFISRATVFSSYRRLLCYFSDE